MVSIVKREDITRNLMFFSGIAQVTSTLGKGFGFCDTCMIDSWWTLHSVLLSIRGRLSDIQELGVPRGKMDSLLFPLNWPLLGMAGRINQVTHRDRQTQKVKVLAAVESLKWINNLWLCIYFSTQKYVLDNKQVQPLSIYLQAFLDLVSMIVMKVFENLTFLRQF